MPSNIDLITHGSPCQDFSIAGLQAGGDKGAGTRSSLMWCTVDIVEKTRPKYVIWENVKNLLSSKHRHNFDNYLKVMESLGYSSYYKVLDAKDYGIPQHRERVFTISIRNDIDAGYKFPEPMELKLRLKDMLEDEVDERYYLDSERTEKLINEFFSRAAEDLRDSKCVRIGGIFDTEKSKHQAGSIYDKEGLCPTLDVAQGGWRQPSVIIKDRIRKLTPLEYWRLMGFGDKDFEKAKNVPMSNTQLYKQAGNSIVINILEKIFKNLFDKEKKSWYK